MPKRFEFLKACRLLSLLSRQTKTRTGSNETDVNELTVSPQGCPSGSDVVTTVMPVAKLPITRRNSSDVIIKALSYPNRNIIREPICRGGYGNPDGTPLSGHFTVTCARNFGLRRSCGTGSSGRAVGECRCDRHG